MRGNTTTEKTNVRKGTSVLRDSRSPGSPGGTGNVVSGRRRRSSAGVPLTVSGPRPEDYR